MSVVVGIDIQPIEEVEASLRTFGERYRRLLFTNHELESSGVGPAAASELATRFAAKEAVFKILDTRVSVPPWRSVEVRCAGNRRPEIALYDVAEDLARKQGIHHITVSLSRAGGVASATVIAQSDGVRP
jgi:holo-[acyl-carrier protein] synthase